MTPFDFVLLALAAWRLAYLLANVHLLCQCMDGAVGLRPVAVRGAARDRDRGGD
jgi:hypothetical protein